MAQKKKVSGSRERERITGSSLPVSKQRTDGTTATLKPNRGKINNSQEGNHPEGSNVIKDAVDSWKRFKQKHLKSK